METVNLIIHYLSWGLLVTGAVVAIIGAVGLLRFPELYTRMHAASVIDSGGAPLILVGLMLQAGLTLETVKLVFILFFLFFTSPTSTYALARGAWSAGYRPMNLDKSSAGEAGGADGMAPSSEQPDAASAAPSAGPADPAKPDA